MLGVGVKGKLIFWILNNDHILLNTLGMTGHWSHEKVKYARLRFDFDTGDPVYFADTRNFGTLKFVKGGNKLKQKLASLGPDMLSDAVTYSQFEEALDKKRHWAVCKALMDQSVVSGVGNYVKAESLYRARISPHRTVGSLNSTELRALFVAVKEVLVSSYNLQGASIRDYKNIDESQGKATTLFQVYGKSHDQLGNQVVKEETADKRVTHWVPTLQN